MTDIYSVIEDDNEVFIGSLIPRDEKVLYKMIIKQIRFYINGYNRLSRDNNYRDVCVWKLYVFKNIIKDLELIVGFNDDIKELIYMLEIQQV